MGANLQSVATSFLLAGASSETIKTVTGLTLNGGHRTMLTFLPSFMTGVSPTMKELVVQGLNFASSPVTGVLMGLEGPFVAPGVSVLNSAEAIVNALSAGDPTAALQDVLAMPANAVGSVFNGSTLNLDALVPVLNPLMSQLGLLPSGTSLTSLDMAFPGLLSPGDVGNTYDYYDYAGNVIDKVPAVGGSLFNDIGLGILANIDGHSIPFDAPSAPAGTLAVLEGLSQAIGQELGDGWVFSGKKSGTSPVPPLSTLTFPQFSDVSANANSAAADAMASINAGDLANLPALVNSLPADVMNSLSSLASLPHEILVNTLLGLF